MTGGGTGIPGRICGAGRIARRGFLQVGAAALAGSRGRSAIAAVPLLESIDTLCPPTPPVPGGTWFHPRVCRAGGRLLMTLQTVTGSDFFGPLHLTTSVDDGATWSEFEPVPPLGRQPAADGWVEGVCDVTPSFHPRSGSVLALGHNVFYRTGHFEADQPPRWPVYAVWRDGGWGPRRKLHWDDPRGSSIYTNNCGQRVMLPDGDVMMSFTFGRKGQPRSVCGVRCGFDGHELVVRSVGPAITNAVGRGLLEPSVTRFRTRFYLTMRAEDGRGYVAVGDDGLQYEPARAWTWDDGEPLAMSTTQQHWLTHSEGLHLVYTRRDPVNVNVFRWRSPLWVAQVDPDTLRLVRSTERVALPLMGDGVGAPDEVPLLGNFGVANVGPDESWVTDGAWRPKRGNQGELQIGRIRWSRPNRLDVAMQPP